MSVRLSVCPSTWKSTYYLKIFTGTNNGGASKSEGHSFELGIQNFSNEKSFTVSMIYIDGSINTTQIT